MKLVLQNFFSSCVSIAKSFKKAKVKLDLLTDIDILLMVEKGIRGRMCHSVYWYVKANNKYMKDCDKNKYCHIFNIAI